MKQLSLFFTSAALFLVFSCQKEQETADALKGTWEVSEVQLNDTTFLNLPNLKYTIEFISCTKAYTATCRAYLNYPLSDTSDVYAKTDSLKYDIRDNELTFTDAQNEAKFGFLLHRFTYTDPNTNELILSEVVNPTSSSKPIIIKLSKK